MVSRFTNAWLRSVTSYPKAVLLVVAALLILAALGLPKLKLDASADSLTLENDQDLNFFRDVSKNYGSGDFLVVTYSPQQDLFSDASLETLRRLQGELTELDGVASVNSILNVPLLYSPKQNLREIANELRTLETPGVDRDQAKREFLTSPIYRDMLLGPDGQTTALQLNIGVDHRYIELVQERDRLRTKQGREGLTGQEKNDLDEVAEAFLRHRTTSEAQAHERVEDVRRIIDKYDDHAQIFVGGISMITADMITFIKKDLVVFGSTALLFMIVVLAVIFRSVRFVVIPMATSVSAVLITLGLISWMDWRLTVISSNFVALLLIISLAIIIHLVVRYREYARDFPGWTQQQLVSETVRFMFKPCLYTAITTMVAFVSLVVSDIRPVMDFGWMMSIGLVFALALAFLVLPSSLMLLPRERAGSAGSVSGRERKPLTLYCAAFVEKHGGVVLLVSVIVAIFSVWGISRLQVENKFIDYFQDDTEIYKSLSIIDNKLGGTTGLDIIIHAKASPDFVTEDGIALSFTDEEDPFAEADAFDEADPFDAPNPVAEEDPFAEADPLSEHGDDRTTFWMTIAGLEQLEQVHAYLESLPEVGKVQSLAILYQVGKDINDGLNNFELAVMNQTLSGEIRDTLVEPYLHGDNETRVTLRVKDTYPGLNRSELVKQIRQHLDSELQLDMEHVRFSGLLVLYNNMLQSLFSSQIVTLGVVFLGIMVMFVLLFRSFLVAAVAIVPSILAASAIIGSMGLMGIPLDMMTITIAAITVGIGVDNTIHYIYRFQTEVVKDGDYLAAMHRAHGSIGRAMYYTSVIIVFGFSIMVLSEFIPTVYFGLLTGLAMFFALLGALFVLPKLILVVKPFKLDSAATDDGEATTPGSLKPQYTDK